MASKGISPLGKHARYADTGRFLRNVGLKNVAHAYRHRAWLAIAILVVLSSRLASTQADVEQANIQPQRLQCEFRTNPQGIDATQPRLNWVLECADSNPEIRGVKQTAYQVLVSSGSKLLDEGQGDLWDSGKVPGDTMFRAVYAGRPLRSWQPCFWKVRAWDQNGRASNWSAPASWTMGVLSNEDWKDAKWIGLAAVEPRPATGAKPTDYHPLAARQLRREFDAPGQVRSATIALSGLGLSELYLNGKKVGDEVLSPPLTEYNKRAMYVVHDVTPLLRHGRNAVAVWLGNGRYWAPRHKEPTTTRTFGPPKLRLILRIESSDGAVQEIVSDEAWKITDQGPIRANNEYDGEQYDARMELAGWAEPGYHDAAWKPVQILPPPGEKLAAQNIEPIRVIEKRRPIARTNPKDGVYVFDLGQNLVGWCRLRVQGPAGTAVQLRHAETLQPDGMLYMANLRGARCADQYTLKGGGVEIYEPRFTYHGFRYVEITGYPGVPANDAIEACVVHDDLEPAGDFACSHELLNRIYANCRWGIRGNYRSIPTDCPQRDERQGWLGDRATGCRGEMQLFNVAAFYEKWLTDIADAQRPDGSVSDVCPAYWPLYNDNVTWAGTIVLIPAWLHEQYGDDQFIIRHYPAMRAWIEHMQKYLADDRMPRDSYGDWCVPPEDPHLIHSKDPARKTSGELIGTAYFEHILRLMSQYAVLAGKPADAARFTALAERMKAAFNKRFFNAATAKYDNGTQASSLVPLSFGLVPEAKRDPLFARLVAKIEGESKLHVGTGLIGVQHLMRVLSDHGRPELALRIATQPDYPSWGYMANKGATTIWELWNGDTADPAMNSGNHVMLIGDLLPWLYEYLAGIRPDPAAPGYRRIVLKPVFVAGLDFVRAWRQTTAGRITSQWSRRNGAIVWNVSVPIGSTATVYVPAKDPANVFESNKPAADAHGVKFLRQEKDAAIYEIGSGTYGFRITE
jgi:alpha-L-rhamnosidase